MSFITAQTGQVIGALGSTVQGIGQMFQAKEEVEVGDYNSEILRQRATAERASGDLLESQKRKILKSNIGTQVSLFANSGIKMSGSPIEVITDSLANAEMDIAIDRYNTEVAARGFESQAQMERFKAEQRERTARAKASSSFISSALTFSKLIPLGGKGENLGAGTTVHGIKVPSRFVPPK